MRTKQLFISLILGLALTLALLWLLGGGAPSAHADSPHYVAPGAICGGVTPCHATIQEAVDAAAPGDEIRVAAGTYTGVNNYGGLAQVVYINKTVTIRGGYITTNWTTPYPITQSTTLDAQGQGRVLYITGNISPTIEGLRITGGDAAGLGGSPWVSGDVGGGVYARIATATISNNQVFSNTADSGGGGLYLLDSEATLGSNTFTANTAGWRGGGGLYLESSTAILDSNTVISNTADSGGGLLLYYSPATLSGNMIRSNVAEVHGGGLALDHSDAVLNGNTISDNTAGQCGGGLYLGGGKALLSANIVASNTAGLDGGGLCLSYGDAVLSGNTVITNTTDGDGGGFYLEFISTAMLSGNTVAFNTARWGGGLYLDNSDATLSGDVVISNTARQGGGLYLGNATLTNTVIANNQASFRGNGLYIEGQARLLHTTIAHNRGGHGSGVYVTDDGLSHNTVALTNTILVSHSVGIMVTAGNTATLEATLWGDGAWANDTDWGGTGTVVTGTRNYWDDPAFVNPNARDYHIGLTSAAIDKGVDAHVDDDIDSDPRPMGHSYDLGADELRIALIVTKQADPDPVQAGEQLTYAIHITNTGNMDLHATVTDTLPGYVTPTGVLTWTTDITAPDGVWTEQVVVTVEMGYAGALTNVIEVTTDEGATGVYTETSLSLAPGLKVTKQADPDPVQAGSLLTYTITVRNTGNTDATGVTITDTIPVSTTFAWADAGGTQVGDQVQWTGKTMSAGGSLAVTFAVTVSGTLTDGNIVANADYSVTCAQGVGASGDVVTTTVGSAPAPPPDIYLPIIMRQ
jgi:uncharacterized repeat protein (TIGR01451 family)